MLAVGCQAIALARGPLVATQAVLSTGLFFALAVGAAMGRRRLALIDITAALALGAGITLLLAVGQPHGTPGEPTGRAWAAVTLVIVGVGVACMFGTRLVGSAAKAALLGAAAGIVFALDSAFLKVVAHAVDTVGLVDGLLRWQTAGLVVAAIAGELLVQQAFALHTLQASLPALTAGEPIAALALGLAVFQERFVMSGLAPLWELIGAALIVGGVVVLTWTTSSADREEHARDVATVNECSTTTRAAGGSGRRT